MKNEQGNPVAGQASSPEERLSSLQDQATPSLAEAEAKGRLILVAEDNIANQEVILEQLNTLGYAAEVVLNGREALQLWQGKRYGLLLTDCQMPEIDGFELTGAIREAERATGTRIPIVAITAIAMKEGADRCFAAGMDDYLRKPVELKALKRILAKWLPKRSDGVPEVPSTGAEASGGEAESSAGAGSPIDPSALKKLVGDDPNLQRRFLKKFIDLAPVTIGEIHAAHANRSAKDIATAAHKLKSSARAIGANALADLCQELEKVGEADNWGEMNTLVSKLDGLMDSVEEHASRVLSAGHSA